MTLIRGSLISLQSATPPRGKGISKTHAPRIVRIRIGDKICGKEGPFEYKLLHFRGEARRASLPANITGPPIAGGFRGVGRRGTLNSTVSRRVRGARIFMETRWRLKLLGPRYSYRRRTLRVSPRDTYAARAGHRAARVASEKEGNRPTRQVVRGRASVHTHWQVGCH